MTTYEIEILGAYQTKEFTEMSIDKRNEILRNLTQPELVAIINLLSFLLAQK